MALLEIDGLSLAIGDTPILRNVSLEVRPGEVLALVGESGSGKSTTALAVLGLLPIGATATGRIRFDGAPLPTDDDAAMQKVRGARIGFVSQEPMTALNPLMTIGDQVAETVLQHGRATRAQARAIAADMLARVGLPADRFPPTRYPHELSGGQRQRVAIAMALALSPRLLLADEPTTALDVTTQAQILALLRELVAERDMGLVLITHDLGVVANFADRVAIMQRGEIVEEGATPAIFQHMLHPYSRQLVAATRHVPVRRTRPGEDAPLLEVRDVVRSYPGRRTSLFGKAEPFRALKGVSLQVRRGESLGVVGESGCGKSTLLRTVLALEPAQAGQVLLAGEAFSPRLPAAAMRRLRRTIQVVFQDPYGSFDPRWRIERIVGEGLGLLEENPSAAERKHIVGATLERVGLSASDAERFPHEFSGGQRQRIAIARALVVRPSIIALDEAVSALDVSARALVLDLLAELSDEFGMSYLFVTHDLSVVRAITDRVIVMKGGEIVEEGSTAALFADPQHPYTRELLAATPLFEEGLARRSAPTTPS